MKNAAQAETTALSRWESEGGSSIERPGARPNAEQLDRSPLTKAELMQTRVRVIALEKLMIALLVKAAAPQLVVAREMAA